MSTSQSIIIPQELNKDRGFALCISESNEKVYSHIQYLKHLVQSMYQLYQKMSKSIIKVTQQYQKKLTKLNDSTALSILNFIKGISKLFHNIREQISNNTVNSNKKNQKVSRTRKDIIHQKLIKINELLAVYFQKVEKYNRKQHEYQEKCAYFNNIQQDVLKFYSTKENKLLFEELKKKQPSIQEQLQETYSLKIELKSGLCQIRLSLKEFFEMLSNNAEDDKKLLMSVRKKLKETKIFNETIIEEVNSEAEESVRYHNNNGGDQPVSPTSHNYYRKQTGTDYENANNSSRLSNITPIMNEEQLCTFSSLNNGITISDDVKEVSHNIRMQEYCIQTFCEFVSLFEKEINQNGQIIDKLRNTEEFQKFIDKKFQMNELLTSDMVYNTESIKNEIADIRQIFQGIKGLLNKKKVINELKKYRAMKFEKFISETEILVDLQKKSQPSQIKDLRHKYKQQKQKFAKGHLQLMRRFRQMVQDMFRDISQEFKFQRNPDLEFRKVKNEFIKKKYYSLLMLVFFVNKEEPPKFQTCPYLKSYEKHMSEENLKKIGLSHVEAEQEEKKHKSTGWGCCGIDIISTSKTQKNKYIDQYNCAIKNGIVLIQGKMKIHENYLKFISSFNAKTFFGQTNIRIPKYDIQSIEKKHVLLSLVITIKTIRGPVSFTSFLSDPHQKLLEIYENKEPTRRNIAKNNVNSIDKPQQTYTPIEEKNTDKTSNETFTITNNYSKSPRNSPANYIGQLEQKFQSQIPELFDQEIINFESLSTYLAQSKKQLSISIQYRLLQNKEKHYFFQIKIIDKNSKIEYKFIHQKSMQNEKIKKMLEKMATQIINNKFNTATSPKRPLALTAKKISNPDEQDQKKVASNTKKSSFLSTKHHEEDRIFEDSYSFIERKQNNQFEFDIDPSFVYVKQPSLAHGGDPSFNYMPDLQIFQNMESQKRITFGPISQNINTNHQRSYRSDGKRSDSSSISKKQIDQYLNSIDEKDIKKSLLNRSKEHQKNLNNKKQKALKTSTISHSLRKNSTQTPKSGLITPNNIILILILLVGLNFIVSIFKN